MKIPLLILLLSSTLISTLAVSYFTVDQIPSMGGALYNVAENQPNLQLLKMQVYVIPYYNANSNALTSFLQSCDYIFQAYNAFNDPILNNYLVKVVQNKLTDRAKLLIGCRTELNTWPLIRNALNDCFGDKKKSRMPRAGSFCCKTSEKRESS